MKKKVMSVFLCAVMTAALLAGCGNTEQEAAAETTEETSGAEETAEPEADGAAEEAAEETAAAEGGSGTMH